MAMHLAAIAVVQNPRTLWKRNTNPVPADPDYPIEIAQQLGIAIGDKFLTKMKNPELACSNAGAEFVALAAKHLQAVKKFGG
ncbi:MAG: hypothetical protein OSA86_06225 [Acidimicrobiales bacterium]|nr:hypothetical protein [Acidimicrobiales bacterium]